MLLRWENTRSERRMVISICYSPFAIRDITR